MNSQTEKSVFPIKTWVIGTDKTDLISSLCPDKQSENSESYLLIADKTQNLSYLFTFYLTDDPPNIQSSKKDQFESGFCILLLFCSSQKTSFETIKSIYSQIIISNSLQKQGFLMLLDVKNSEEQKQIPSSLAEAFASENGMFYLEISLGLPKKNLELLQKIMRIRASHLQRKEPKDSKLAKTQRKSPINLSPEENSYDLPLKTPQFTKELMVLSKEKLQINKQNPVIKPLSQTISSQISVPEVPSYSKAQSQTQVPSFTQPPSYMQAPSYTQAPSYSQSHKLKENTADIKEFVKKKDAFIPVFETSLTERSPKKKREVLLVSGSNYGKSKKKAQRSFYEAGKENIRDLGIIEIELEGDVLCRIPLLAEDDAFSIVDRLMKLVDQQWGAQKVKKMAMLVENAVNEHIDSMVNKEI